MTYQNIFNETLKDIRMVCGATGNDALANTIVKRLFDFSDELKDNNLIKDTDNDSKETNSK